MIFRFASICLSLKAEVDQMGFIPKQSLYLSSREPTQRMPEVMLTGRLVMVLSTARKYRRKDCHVALEYGPCLRKAHDCSKGLQPARNSDKVHLKRR